MFPIFSEAPVVASADVESEFVTDASVLVEAWNKESTFHVLFTRTNRRTLTCPLSSSVSAVAVSPAILQLTLDS